ncbi:MAG TPA: hypothetical protein VNZ52_16235 [Candidatus Thermoplasmatota archaeon]|nr:hypothetical protein [Candidatus Thermoplasmatota archaeon]
MADPVLLNLAVFLAISTLGFAVLLTLVSLLSFARLRNFKFLVVGVAFALLAVKGALWTHRTAFLKEEGHLLDIALDFGVLALLYASVALRAARAEPRDRSATLTPSTR